MHAEANRRDILLSWTIVLLAILGATLVRLRLAGIPLERDEGEYAYMAQLILKGIPPYLAAYSMKLPGIFVAYAVNMVLFGQTIEGIHLGLTFVNALNVLLVFLLARRLLGRYAGALAAFFFAFLALGKSVLGLTANSEHFLILPLVAGLLLLIMALDSKKDVLLSASGLLLGCAFMIKQHGIFFILFGVIYILWVQFRARPFSYADAIRKVSLFGLGSAAPFVVACLIFYGIGIFDKFWFWTFIYPRSYVAYAPASRAISSFVSSFGKVIMWAPLLWLFAGIGSIGLWLDREMRPKAVFIAGLLISSFCAITPGFYFRNHYFILLLPAASILAACAARFCGKGRTAPAVFLLIAVVAFSIFPQREFLFRMNPAEASREMYGPDLFPFTETLKVAQYIRDNSGQDEKVLVMGSEPQIYFYLNRRSPTPYLYLYFLTERHPYTQRMQKEFIEKAEASSPEYIVFVPSWYSDFVSNDAVASLGKWHKAYLESNYKIVGIADIISRGKTEYRWGKEAAGYVLHPGLVVLVFERKTNK